MGVLTRVTHAQFVTELDKEYLGEYDLWDLMDEHATELFETGSVTVEVGDKRFVLALTIDREFSR